MQWTVSALVCGSGCDFVFCTLAYVPVVLLLYVSRTLVFISWSCVFFSVQFVFFCVSTVRFSVCNLNLCICNLNLCFACCVCRVQARSPGNYVRIRGVHESLNTRVIVILICVLLCLSCAGPANYICAMMCVWITKHTSFPLSFLPFCPCPCLPFWLWVLWLVYLAGFFLSFFLSTAASSSLWLVNK